MLGGAAKKKKKSLTNLLRVFSRDCPAAETVSREPGNASLWGKCKRGLDRAGEWRIWGSQPARRIAQGRLAGLGGAADKGAHLLSLFPSWPLTPGCHQQDCPKRDTCGFPSRVYGQDPTRSQQITTPPSAGLCLALQSKNPRLSPAPKPGTPLPLLNSAQFSGVGETDPRPPSLPLHPTGATISESHALAMATGAWPRAATAMGPRGGNITQTGQSRASYVYTAHVPFLWVPRGGAVSLGCAWPQPSSWRKAAQPRQGATRPMPREPRAREPEHHSAWTVSEGRPPLWHAGSAVVGSSRTRARTRVPCIGRRILNHCATRGAPNSEFSIILLSWL